MSKRILLIVAYDGTNYHGWQLQPNGITIESELNKQISELTGENIQVIGASRTDAGVHALGNVAVFDTNSPIPGNKFTYALNCRLPQDIKIQKSMEVSSDFHPRKCSSRKTYEYRITCAPLPIPTKRLYSYYIYHEPNIEIMQEAATLFIGEHDFKSFCAVASQAETTVRTIYLLQVEKEGNDIVIRVAGSGFLYNMVRIIAGTLLEVGLERRSKEQIAAALVGKDRKLAGPTAPANGLTLVSYEFL